MIKISDVATRVDHEGSYREVVSFPQVGEVRMFSVAHRPDSSVRGGMVICPPILMDFLKNYRHEVLLARVLASRGIAVQRFHYRGTGHSEGDEGEISGATLVQDALTAAGWLEQVGVPKIAFLGTRWGARVAAAAVRNYPGAPLVLWDPVVVPGKYIRELIMGRLLRETKERRVAGAMGDGNGSGAVAQRGRWEEEIIRDGRTDILGYSLYRWLYESTRGPALDEILAESGPRPVFLVQIGALTAHHPDLTKLKTSVERAGGRCELAVIREEPGWLFSGHRLKQSQKLVQISADWLTAQHGS